MAGRDQVAAIIQYRNAVDADPSSASARIKLGDAYVAIRDGRGAVEQYVRAADLRPDDVTLQLTAARLFLLAGQYEDARGRLDKALRVDATNLDAQLMMAEAQVALREPEGALATIRSAIAHDSTQSRSFTALGTLHFSQGRLPDAEAAFRHAVALAPQSPQPLLALGYFLRDSGRTSDAERAFLDAIAIDSDLVDAHRSLASLYQAVKRTREAEAHLVALSRLVPEPEQQLILADFYLEQGRLEEAKTILESVRGDVRVTGKADERLAIVDFRSGNYAQAYSRVDAVLARERLNLDAMLTKTKFLFAQNRLDEAITVASDTIRSNPRVTQAHFLLGRLYAAKNQREAAMRSFQDVLKLNPRAVEAHIQMGELFLAEGDSRQAIDAATSALVLQPSYRDALMLRARGLLAAGDLEGAEPILAGLAAYDQGGSDVQTELGRLATAKQDFAAAAKYFERALERDPASRPALEGLVALLIRVRQTDVIRRDLEARLDKSPRDSGLLMLLASVHAAERNLGAQESALKRVIELDPANLLAYVRLGQLYVQTNRLDEARAEYQRAVTQPDARGKGLISTLTMLGLVLEAQGRTEHAREAYEQALKLDPEAPVAANNLAMIYLETGGDLDTALRMALRARERLPLHPAANDTVGWLYYNKRMAAEAIPYLELSVTQDGANATYHFHAGMAYWRKGETLKAQQALQKALALRADFAGAAEAKRVLDLIRGGGRADAPRSGSGA